MIIIKQPQFEELLISKRSANITTRRRSMNINGFSSGNNAILFKNVTNKPFVSKHRSLRANTTIVSANRVQTSSSTLSKNEKLTQVSALLASNGNIGGIIEDNLAENVHLNSSALVQRDSQGPMDYENGNGLLSPSEIPASSSNGSIAEAVDNVSNFLSVQAELENSIDGTTADSNDILLPFLPQVEQPSNAEIYLFESPPVSIIDQNVPFFVDLPTPIQPGKLKRPVPLLMPICDFMTVNRHDQVKQFPPRRPSIAARIVFDHATKETVSKETITDNESFSESEDSFGRLIYESSSDE